MGGVLTGFAIVIALIAVGYVLGRAGTLGPNAEFVLTRFSFNAALPALLFTLVAPAHISDIVTPQFAAMATAALAGIGVYLVIGSWRRWGLVPTTIGALASGYANAGNLGIPVAVYVLGSAAPIVPVMLFQLLFLAPVTLGVLDALTGARAGLGAKLLAPLRNPVVIAALGALVCSVGGIVIPEAVMQPLQLLGQATVPVMLTAFGISLNEHARPLSEGRASPVLLAVGLKLIGGPVITWAVGSWLLHLAAEPLLQAVVCSALPTAQNIYIYSLRYPDPRAHRLGRDIVFVSTLASLPVILLVVLMVGQH
ncbi:MAG: AEC family transporter [Propionicimonas sp.]